MNEILGSTNETLFFYKIKEGNILLKNVDEFQTF